jgi:hypothetical protein
MPSTSEAGGKQPSGVTRRGFSALLGAMPAAAMVHQQDAARKLGPYDEAKRDPALVETITHIRGIVARKDYKALMALISPTFKIDVIGTKGPVNFEKFWKPSSPDSPVWPVLSHMLPIGGTFYTPSLFALPYVYTRFPVDLDPFTSVVALKESVPVHETAAKDSSTIATLSYDIVTADPAPAVPVRLDKSPWVGIIAPGGKKGFVSSEDVYSPAGYRSFFEKEKGKWQILGLICSEL